MKLFSLTYIIFYAIIFFLFIITKDKWKKYLIAIASIAFYAFTSVVLLWYVLFILGIIFYINEKYYHHNFEKSVKPTIGITLILFILFIFKYNLFISLFYDISETEISSFLRILYPIGISYITFQAIGFILDLKYKKLDEKPDLVNLIIYLFFFPKVISGPIEKAYFFLPQLKNITLKAENIRIGLIMIMWGVFKKFVIADKLGLAVDKFYSSPSTFSDIDSFIVSFFYAIQIYTDFSGYSDIALGSSKIFGINVIQNFRSPFLSKSITEFWRRWHISLGDWFKEYYYTIVAMALRSYREIGVFFALLSTFILIGLWHGLTSGFVLFGLLHGIAIVYEYKTRKIRLKLGKRFYARLTSFASILITFSFYSLTCVVFRSISFSQSILVVKKSILGIVKLLGTLTDPSSLMLISTRFITKFGYFKLDMFIIILTLVILFGIDIQKKAIDLNTYLDSKSKYFRWAFYYVITILILFFGSFNSVQSFIYKQF